MIERIKEIISKSNLTASKFADKIGVQKSGISHILSGRNKPSLELVQKILKQFPEIDSNWLLNGKGSMKINTDDNLFSQKSKEDINQEQQSKRLPNIVSSVNGLNKKIEKHYGKIQNGDAVHKENENNELSKEIERIVIFFNDRSFEEYNRGL